MTHPTGIEEVVALESAIRAGLKTARGKLGLEAREILHGRPATGTRLAALRDIAGRMGNVCN